MNISPAFAAFASEISTHLVFGEVQVRRVNAGFELRHIADGEAAETSLKLLAAGDLRRLAQFTGAGAFRPLKSAPNLSGGWRAVLSGEGALERALAHLYPGAVADWFAIHHGAGIGRPAKITSYREFTGRQTGMYRITTKLDDTLAEAVVRSCCARDFCLKQRLWTVNGSSPGPDAVEERSLIPCLEPCAILLEFARKIVRLEQDEARACSAPSQSEAAALPNDCPAANPGASIVESDFDDPNNPRRQRFVLEKERLRIKWQ
jgi:hypothetical protein